MKVKIEKVHPDAIIPTYATEGAACFDLYSLGEEQVFFNDPKTFRTGLAFEIPEGNVMLIFSRSGAAFKDDVRLANCVGVIDSDYRGEVMVKLTKDTDFGESYTVDYGDRIAQGMVLPVERVEFVLGYTLSGTSRGGSGFGHTGK